MSTFHRRALRAARRSSAASGLLLTALLAAVPQSALGQDLQTDNTAAARAGAIAHVQKMRRLFPDIGGTRKRHHLLFRSWR